MEQPIYALGGPQMACGGAELIEMFKAELDKASAAFEKVIQNFPQSSKMPDALYKQGLLRARQGKPDESRALLERVRNEYPDSSAAGLANDFLNRSAD